MGVTESRGEPGFNGPRVVSFGRPGALRDLSTGGTVAKGKAVRVGNAARLEQLRVLLEAISGETVTTAAAVDAGVSQLLASLGEGADLAMFSVPALQRLMADRTRAVVGAIAQKVAVEVSDFLRRSGFPAELVVGISKDGRQVAAQVVTASPLPDVYPVSHTIEA